MIHPLVSVIIPNYNHAAFLDERISSVLNQSYDAFELIILDDKSTDNSKSIIDKYKNDNHVSHITINDKNSGSPFIQWQKGFELANGQLIWIAESDDSCDNSFLETLVRIFEKDPYCDLAFCKSIIIDQNGHVSGEEGASFSYSMKGERFIKKYLSKYNYIINASSAVFTKKSLVNVCSDYTKFRGCGDWVFWAEISKNGNVSYDCHPMNRFRNHGNNTTSQQTKTGIGEFEVANVTEYLRSKKYISFFDFFRAKVVHIYSVKYGKMKGVLTASDIRKLCQIWRCDIFFFFFVEALHLFSILGLKIINR